MTSFRRPVVRSAVANAGRAQPFRAWTATGPAAAEAARSGGRRRRSFRVLLAAAFGAIALLASGGAAILAQREAVAALRADAAADLTEAARGLAEILDRGLFERWRDVQVAAALGNALRDPGASVEARRAELRRIRDTLPDYALVMLISPEGRILATHSGLVEGADVSRRDYFLGGREGPFAGDVHDALLLRGRVSRPVPQELRPRGTSPPPGAEEPPRFVDIAAPVRSPGGELIGVVAAHLFWEWAEDVEATVLGPLRARRPGAEGFIVSADGTVLLGPLGWRGRQLGSRDAAGLPGAIAGAVAERRSGQAVLPWQAPPGLENGPAPTFVAGWAPANGHGRYPGLGWTVVARQEAGTALAPAGQLRDRILLWGCGTALLAALLGWVLAARLARPIEALARLSGALESRAGGGWNAAAAGPREAAALAGALTSLAADRDAADQDLGRAREGLRESEAFLRSVLDASTDCVKVADPHGRLEFMNANGQRLLGIQGFHQVEGKDWALLWPEETRPRVRRAIEAARAGREDRFEAPGPAAEGAPRWWDVVVSPIRDAAGQVGRIVSVARDVTARREAEERQRLLMREVDHRAKNALAVVQAALRLTRAPDLPSYVTVIEGRIAALARAQSLLAEDRWAGADLRRLLRGELAAFIDGDGGGGPSVALSGPDLALPVGAAQPFAMAVHEMATNAVKYGALSAPSGRIDIAWHVDGGPSGRLFLRWAESGGPAIATPPARRGFGTRVIQGTVRDQLSGHLSLYWRSEGLTCELEVPLARDVAEPCALPSAG